MIEQVNSKLQANNYNHLKYKELDKKPSNRVETFINFLAKIWSIKHSHFINMTTSEEILIIANQLANAGKKPTVALVKTKLSQPVPLALLINTLKNWQHQPEHIKFTSNNNQRPSEKIPAPNDISLLIANAVKPLHQEINQLKQQIKELKAQIQKIS